jgi:indolepyruvate ferredoxin oxidoreductase
MAAHIDGKQASTLDMTGLAQKGGPVTSHVRFAGSSKAIEGPRVPAASLDLLIASDMVVAANAEQLALAHRGKTVTVANTKVAPTAEFVLKQTLSFDEMKMDTALKEASGTYLAMDAAGIAEKLLGDAIFANMLLVGMAYQAGALPISGDAIETSLELNGAAVAGNIKAFRAGRVLAADPELLLKALPASEMPREFTLDEKIAFNAEELVRYQDVAYAERYLDLVGKIKAADTTHGPGPMRLTRTVADLLYKLMAYKDEYEVARLYSDPAFKQKIAQRFEDPKKLRVYLAPPMLAHRKDPKTGRPEKIAFGPWIFSVFKLLAGFKGMRGKWYDPFGRTAERKAERALIAQYEKDIADIVNRLPGGNYGLLVELARVPDLIRGFGPMKEANLEKAAEKRRVLLEQLNKAKDDGSDGDETGSGFLQAAE